MDVNGLAVDWLSGSIYWSDAKYDWISMANVEKLDIYRHIITQDMEQPMGLVVHPKRGYDFKILKITLNISNIWLRVEFKIQCQRFFAKFVYYII